MPCKDDHADVNEGRRNEATAEHPSEVKSTEGWQDAT